MSAAAGSAVCTTCRVGDKLILVACKQCSMIVVPWGHNIHYAGVHVHRATYPAQVLPWILIVRPGRFTRFSADRRSRALPGQAFSRKVDLAAWLPFRIAPERQPGSRIGCSAACLPTRDSCSAMESRAALTRRSGMGEFSKATAKPAPGMWRGQGNRLHNEYSDLTGPQSSNNDCRPSVLICRPRGR